MAVAVAAAASRTKGLFFILTLLCLVCLTSVLIDKNQLEKNKEELQRAEQEIHRLKAERASISELMRESMSFMVPLIAVVKKTLKASPDFLPLEEFLENIKDFMEKTNERNEKLGAKMQNTEQKLGKVKKLIQFLEEHQAEL
ncbi:uncharacterized protein ABDE67_020987 [Symphorus nematophorus]